jgi:hypothetical protein
VFSADFEPHITYPQRESALIQDCDAWPIISHDLFIRHTVPKYRAYYHLQPSHRLTALMDERPR